MNNPALPTITPEEIEKRFKAQEDKFVVIEKCLATLRAFLAKFKEQIAPFEFHAYESSGAPHIYFDCTYNNKDQQKNIATALGKEGWEREKDNFTCGRINWSKVVDGVEIKITGAEHLNPNLIKEVKL